jgi:hypothetical protein
MQPTRAAKSAPNMKLMNHVATTTLAAIFATAAGAASAQPWRWGDEGNWPMHRWGEMGFGMMGPGMSPMMFVMMDTDGDSAVSLEEMQAVHKRMFDLVDKDKDGKVTVDEMHGFWGVRRNAE